MALDLISIGFQIDNKALSDADAKLQAVLDKAGKLDKKLSNLGSGAKDNQATKEVESLSKAIGEVDSATTKTTAKVKKASKEQEQSIDGVTDALTKSQKVLKKNTLINDFLTKDFTLGMSKQLASLTMLDAEAKEITALQDLLISQRKLMGGKDPFDDSLGAMKKASNELREMRVQYESLSNGISLTKKQVRGLLDIETRLGESGKSKSDIEAIKRSYLESTNQTQLMDSSIKSITKSTELANKQAEKQLTIRREIYSEVEKLNRLKSIKSEGFTSASAKKIMDAESAGIAPEALNSLKDALRITKQSKDGYTALFEVLGGVGTKATRQQEAELARLNKTQAENNRLVALKTEGFSGAQSRQIMKAEVAGVSQEAINKLKDSFKSVSVETERAAKSVEKVNLQTAKAVTMGSLLKEGFTRSSAAIIANASNMGVSDAQLESLRRARAEYDQISASVNKSTGVFAVFKGTLAALGIQELGSRFLQFTRYIIDSADAMAQVEAKIKLVSAANEDFNETQAKLFQVANNTRQPISELAQLYSRLAPALRPFGKTTDEVLSITESFGKTLLISGANARESASAILQFAQAMGSGKLAGDEFRAVSEANPALLMALARGLGVARGALKDMASEGKLTTEAVSNALAKQKESIDILSQGIPATLGNSVTTLDNSFRILVDTLNDSLGVTKGITALLGRMSNTFTEANSTAESLAPTLKIIGSTFGFIVKNLDTLLVSFAVYKGVMLLSAGANGLFTFSVVSATRALGFKAIAMYGVVTAAGAMMTAISAVRVAVLGLYAVVAANPIALALGLAAGAYFAYTKVVEENTKKQEQAAGASKAIAERAKVATQELEYQKTVVAALGNEYPRLVAEMKRNVTLTDEQNKSVETQKKQLDNLLAAYKSGKITQAEYASQVDIVTRAINNITEAFKLANIEKEIFNKTGIDQEAFKGIQKETSDLKEVNTLISKGYSKDVSESVVRLLGGAEKMKKVLKDSPEIFLANFKTVLKTARENESQKRINTSLTKDPEKPKAPKDIAKNVDQYAQQISDLERLIPLLGQVEDAEVARISLQEEYGKRYGADLTVAMRIVELRKQEAFELSKIAAIKAVSDFRQESADIALKLDSYEQMIDGETELLILKNMQKGISAEETLSQIALGKQLADTKAKYDSVATSIANIVAEQAKAETNPLAAIADFDLSSIFGEIGNPFNQVIDGFSQVIEQSNVYADQLKLLEQKKLKLQAAGKDTVDVEKEISAVTKNNAKAEIRNIGNILGATKGFFKEKSAGYKVLSAAEKAFRIFEIAEAVKAFAIKKLFTAEEIALHAAGTATKEGVETGFTAFTVIQKGIQATASGIAALASSMAGLPFPLNLAAFAATGALLASIGLSLGGGKKSGSFAPTNEGTGTVFGDKSAKSESIKRSIDLLAENSKIELPITSAMLRSLQNIEANIGGLTNLVIRGGAAEDLAKTVSTGFKESGLGKGLRTAVGIVTLGASELLGIGKLIGGLFGTKISIKGQGLLGEAQNLSSITSEGFNLKEYVDINKKKKSFGFTTSSKNSTKTSAASDELERQFTLIFTGFYDAIKMASVPLGQNLNDVTSRLDNFVVNIGKINLKGLKGSEIQEKLEAVFGAAADSIAQAAIPGLEDFQKVGEGYFETVVRVSSGIEQAAQALSELGISSVNYKDIANKQGDVTAELIRESIVAQEVFNGISLIISTINGEGSEIIEVYKALLDVKFAMQSLGLSGEAVSISLVQGAGGLDKLKDGLESYFENILPASKNLERQALSVATSFIRLGITMPKTNAEFQALVESIDTTTESGQKLFGSVIALAPAFSDLTSSIEDVFGSVQEAIDDLVKYREELNRGPQALLNPTAQYLADKALFESTSVKAKAGDISAINSLQGVSNEFLESSKKYYASSGKYFEDLNSVKGVVDDVIATNGRQLTDAEKQLEQLKTIDGSIRALEVAIQKAKEDQIASDQKIAEAAANKAATEAEKNRTFIAGRIDFNGNKTVSALEEAASKFAVITDKSFGMVQQALLATGLKQLTEAQLRVALQGIASSEDISSAIKAIDENGDGIVSQIELDKTRNQRLTDLLLASGDLRKITELGFNAIDKNLDGKITSQEMSQYLKDELGLIATDSQLKNIIASIDTNGNGTIAKLEVISDELKRKNAIGVAALIGEADAGKISQNALATFGAQISTSTPNYGGYAGSTEIQIERAIAQRTGVNLSEFEALNAQDIQTLASNLGISNSDVQGLGENVLARVIGDSQVKMMDTNIARQIGNKITSLVAAPSPINQKYGNYKEPRIEAGLSQFLGLSKSSFDMISAEAGQSLAKALKIDSTYFDKFAKGGMFTNGIVSSPTLFPIGMMGEAGPEAIMPLARGSDGSLGVRIVGGGNSSAGVEAKLEEGNRQAAALLRLQQAANQKIIEKLSMMEERLDGLESAARLEAAS